MREMKIKEVDSQCYIVETSDFVNTQDSAIYHHDTTTRSFYAEYQRATQDKRQFQRDYFDFAENPTIGDAINFIMKLERDACDSRFRGLVRSITPRVVDRIDV